MNQNPLIKHLREQYSPGTRIRLGEMRDPYAPVPPGTLGSVSMVDDAGTVHIRWDNGRTLGLIPGEDSFSIVEQKQELTHSKLYMPITCDLYTSIFNVGDSPSISDNEIMEYKDEIAAAMEKYNQAIESERGLMHWYQEQDGVNDKVHSAEFSVEDRADTLWGIIKLEIKGELDAQETDTLLDYLTGQASNGMGKEFSQQEIEVGDGGIHVHLWDSSEDWNLMTEAQFEQKYEQSQQLDNMSY